MPTDSTNTTGAAALEVDAQHAIDIENYSFRYPKADADTLYIPRWQIPEGQHVFLQGESGSGKTTLLQLLCGLRVGKGHLAICGEELGRLPSAKRDSFRAANIGMVFQQFNLIPYLSMVDNVVLAATLAGKGKGKGHGAEARARTLLQQVGLEERLWKQKAESLSIGQQQRVAIARAMINSPPLLLLDEPTSALDGKNQGLFMDVLMSHLRAQPKTTVIFVSHDPRLASYLQTTVQLADIVSVNQKIESAEIKTEAGSA